MGLPVYLSVRDLARSNAVLYPLGAGKYRSDVQVNGATYAFLAKRGVVQLAGPPPAGLRARVLIGVTDLDRDGIEDVLTDLRRAFKADGYDRVGRNSNNFAQELCLRLTGRGIPDWVNLQYDLLAFFYWRA